MKNYVITIARQYGSGGRTVGEMLAKKLGIAYYDKDIIRMASEDSGINETLFGTVDEYSTDRIRSLSRKLLYKGELIPPQSKEFTSDENLFNYQAKIIRQLADTESCVIIGRCGNYILKDHPNVLRCFVHADWAFRMEKAAGKLSMSPSEIERFMKKDDKRKRDIYRRFTGTEWTDATNYDLCLDASQLGFEGCVEEIEHRLKKMTENL